jgi:hypothetical protein
MHDTHDTHENRTGVVLDGADDAARGEGAVGAGVLDGVAGQVHVVQRSAPATLKVLEKKKKEYKY